MNSYYRAVSSAVIVNAALLALSGSVNAQTAANLGSAQLFTVLGGSAVTSTGASVINGNLGVSPGISITGFPPGMVINGSININTGPAVSAHADANTAYNYLAGLQSTGNLTGVNLGGLILAPGVYQFASSAQLTGTLELNNTLNPTGAYVFQIGSSLTTGPNSAVLVLGGSDPNVFWQVGSSASLGTGTSFDGNIVAFTSISLDPAASLSVGRALAINGAVTLAGGNNINLAAILPPPVSIPTTGTYWNGNVNNTWSGQNWSPDATGATDTFLAPGANVVFSVTGVPPINQSTLLDAPESIASLTVNDTVPVTITGPNLLSITGPTDTRSTITINSGAGLVTINSNILLGQNVSGIAGIAVNNTAGLAIDGVVSGVSGLTKQGAGTLFLTNSNIYSGNTAFGLTGDVTAGTVNIGNGATDGSTINTPTAITPFSTTGITVNAATTLTTDGATTRNSYSLANNFTLSLPLTVTVPTATSLTMTGKITGVDGLFINSGNATMGSLILSGNGTGNTYSGPTILTGGTLQAATKSGTGNAFSANSDFSLSNASVLSINGNNETIASLAGTTGTTVSDIANGSATLTINDAKSSILGTVPVYTYSGTITDGGPSNSLSLVKQGTGTLILAGNNGTTATGNTYSGSTQISGGTLQAATKSGTGNAFSANSDYSLSGGSLLSINGNNETIASLSGTTGTTVSDIANGSATLTINDAKSSILGTVPVYTYSGTITDGGASNSLSLVKQGTGTLILAGNNGTTATGNTYSGSTQISGGTLQAATKSGTGNAFSANSDYSLSGGSLLSINGNNETIASLSGTTGTMVNNIANGSATLTINDAKSSTPGGTYTYSGTITDGGASNSLSLVKQGTGTFILAGNNGTTATGNTYSGSTQISGGTLQAATKSGTGNAFSANSDYSLSGGSLLSINGNNETIASLAGTTGTMVNNIANGSATLTINDAKSSTPGGTYTYSGTITDGGASNSLSLVKQGTGTFIVAGNNGTTATGNTYSGSTQISGGTLQAATKSGTGNAFSANSDYSLSGGSVLSINGNNETIASLSGTTGTMVDNIANGSATLTINDAKSSTPGGTYTYSGTITDGGASNSLSLVKQGTGTFIVAGNNGTTATGNTYSGSTQISGGTLQAATKSGTGNAFSANSDYSLSGGSLLSINGNNETIASLAGTTGTTVSDIANGSATLTINDAKSSTPGCTYTYSGTITDGGASNSLSLVKQGTGTFIVAGNNGTTATGNTYSGSTQISGGTLQAATKSGTGNAFSANSDYSLSGGSLLSINGNNETIASLAGTTGTTVSDIANGSATLTINDAKSSTPGGTYTYSGTITDGGASNSLSLVKQGTGTFIVAGNNGTTATGNTYSGSTQISGGTLQAATKSGTGNAFSANSDFSLSNAGALSLNGNSETIASLTGTSSTIVNNIANGSATLSINDTKSSIAGPIPIYEFDGTLTDAGVLNSLALVKQGTGTLILTGSNGYNGGTTISAGTIVAGSATSGSHVSNAFGNGNLVNAGTLETTATQASTTGSTTEAIQVKGTYTQTSSGTLLLQVASSPAPTPSRNSGTAGTNYDTVTANKAVLGGTLDLNFSPSSVPSVGQHYVAVSTGNPLSSQFLYPTKTNLASFDPTFYTLTTYNDTFGGSEPADSAIVTLIKPFALDSCLNPNQANVAANIDQILNILSHNGSFNSPTGAPLDYINNIVTGLNAASNQGCAAIGSALDELSPQRFEIFRNLAFDNYAFDIQNLDDELARERLGQGGIDTSGFTFNDPKLGPELSQVESRLQWGASEPDPKDVKDLQETNADVPLNRWNFFIDGGASLGDLDSNSNVSHSSYVTARVRSGIDYRIGRDFRVGALFGYSHSDIDLDEEGSKAHVSGYTPGLYAAYADKEGFYANGLFTYTRNDYSTDRNIIFPGVNRTASGSTGGNQFGMDADGGYEFHRKDWTFGPYAGLSYVNLGIDNFNESGASAANLGINNQSYDSLRSRLGGTVRYAATIGSVVVTPHASAFWQHEFLNETGYITSQFEGLPGGTFSVQSPRGDKDTALLGFGVDTELNRTITLFVDYQAEAGGATFFSQAASAGLKISF